MTANEIINGLWIGDLTSSHFFQGPKLCLKTQKPPEYIFKSKHDIHLPITYGNVTKENLDIACDWINQQIRYNRPALVHCSGGIHRSPLIVAYWLTVERNYNIHDAYTHLQEIRPEIERRDKWLTRHGII